MSQVTIKHVIDAFEKRVPPSLAESWDNPGLQLGNPHQEVTGIVTTLDVTEEAMHIAVRKGANLIISHHPLLFKGIKCIDESTAEGSLIASLLRHRITVYSAHTNYDVVKGGINDLVAEKLQLQDVKGLVKTSGTEQVKVVVYAPLEASEAIRKAFVSVGAGKIGSYEGCSFSSAGTGRFLPLMGAAPFIGRVGQVEEVSEEKIEAMIDGTKVGAVIQAIRAVHPYEEPAIEVYPLSYPEEVHTIGRVGLLPRALLEKEFLQLVQNLFRKSPVRFGGAHKGSIRKIALCTGSGAEFMVAAKAMGADAYLTGDVKYHDMQRAKALDLLVADAGHFATEELAAEGLASIVEDLLDSMNVEKTRVFRNEKQQDFFFL